MVATELDWFIKGVIVHISKSFILGFRTHEGLQLRVISFLLLLTHVIKVQSVARVHKGKQEKNETASLLPL